MAAPTNAFSDGLDLLVKENESIGQIYKSLCEWGCCPMCSLRYLGEKQQEKYKFSQKDIHTYLSSLSLAPTPSFVEETCCTCLGILQKLTTKEFMLTIDKKVKDGKNKYTDFRIAISLPVASIVREHAILVLLIENFQLSYRGKRENEFVDIKDVWKWVCLDQLSAILKIPSDVKSPFDITLNFDHDGVKKECDFLKFMCPHIFQERKNNRFGWEMFTRMNVRRAVATVRYASFKHYSQCPPKKLNVPASCVDIVCSHEPIYICGRYNKYSRELSQTPWFIDGVRKTEHSVEERICELLDKNTECVDHKFSSSGREDVDVRMLGTGRPFMVEIIKPKKVTFTQAEMTQIQKQINADTVDVRVTDLQVCTKEETSHLIKAGEMTMCKSYAALCWMKEVVKQADLDKLKEIEDLKVDQKTPIRVLHRRPLATREKIVHSISADRVDDHHFKMLIRTGAGTYIKEFVHGDFCRTKPGLRTLLNSECDILELDVVEVELDWPPKIVKNEKIMKTEAE